MAAYCAVTSSSLPSWPSCRRASTP
jgi:hypothetical protein